MGTFIELPLVIFVSLVVHVYRTLSSHGPTLLRSDRIRLNLPLQFLHCTSTQNSPECPLTFL